MVDGWNEKGSLGVHVESFCSMSGKGHHVVDLCLQLVKVKLSISIAEISKISGWGKTSLE